ncbi:rubrerythrin [Halolamina salifodinae]|uniref:Rubrerythrin n=1 Tax=Halolamina salifodinae TaxID=1202767 RepID=A0A8T4GZG0_9EURY|nr:rubrerythrin [Halolamina salifodinae]
MKDEKPINERIKEQFEECESDEGWYRCKVCGVKHYYGQSRKSDLLRHLDSHD